MTVTGTPGVGTITLNAAVSGYLTFALAGVPNATLVSYGVKDGSNSEAGIGIYTSSGTTLSRLRIFNSTNGNAAVSLTSAAEVFVTALAHDLVLPKGYLYGLTLSNNVTDVTNDIDIAVGEAADSTGVLNMSLPSSITKRLDAAWAVGTGNGGRMSAAAITDTTYHMWLIQRSDTGVVDVGFDVSATSPTMPTNYDYKRRIGSIVRTSGAIKPFLQIDDNFRWLVPVQDVAVTNPGTAAVTRTLTIPLGLVLDANIAVADQAIATNHFGLITSLALTDTTPSISAFSYVANSTGPTTQYYNVNLVVPTNTSAQIRSRQSNSGAGDTLTIVTNGWRDARGKS